MPQTTQVKQNVNLQWVDLGRNSRYLVEISNLLLNAQFMELHYTQVSINYLNAIMQFKFIEHRKLKHASLI